ncbi:thioredoxin-like protein [Mycena sp. CBHHK59/15]|nr:thioredoxin-like protein [Mycena sp. CBHHK59/15]
MATPALKLLRTPALRTPVLTTRSLHSSPSRRVQFINASKADFDRAVTNAPPDRLVLVDFYAEWCGPCHALSPVLRRLADTHAPPFDLLTVDVEDEPRGGFALSQAHKVRALPTVVAYRGGKRVDQFVGALNEPAVVAFINKV